MRKKCLHYLLNPLNLNDEEYGDNCERADPQDYGHNIRLRVDLIMKMIVGWNSNHKFYIRRSTSITPAEWRPNTACD